MKKLFRNGLQLGMLALIFPIVGTAQLQVVDGSMLRTQAHPPAGTGVLVETRQQFRTFARSLPDADISPDRAKAAVVNAGNTGAINLANYSIEEATIIIMQLVAEEAEADLKTQLAEMEANRKQKAAARADNAMMQQDKEKLAAQSRLRVTGSPVEAGTLAQHEDSTSQRSESMSRRLQAHQDRRAQAMETLRKLLEASSSTESTVIGNIK